MLDSELNPEAPEFHPLPDPELTTTLEEGYKHMTQAVRASNTFPIGASYDLYQTYTDFNVVICKIRNNVICLTSQIMVLDHPSATLTSDDNDGNSDTIVDANDNLLDRINVHIDTKSGELKSSMAVTCGAQLAAWNRAPVLNTVKVNDGLVSLIGAKNIPRPQLMFKEPVDNSEKIFVPRIHDKPNSIKPLALTILYNDAGEPVGYEHPYEVELQLYSPPEWALEAREEPAAPPPLDATPLTLVQTAAQLEELVRHLDTVLEMAVDLEHHAYRTYLGFTCLIQISTDEGGDFIVDALALRDQLHALNHSFTDPKKVKVFHGAEQDIQWLQRDFGVYVVGLFDTHKAARLLGLEGLSLKHLLHKYCNIQADKTHQLADWRMRPLPDELVKYARSDTHSLLYVWRRLRADLLRQDAALPRTAFQLSAQVAHMTYAKPGARSDAHMALYARSGKRFTCAQLTALRAVWAWRDEHARAADESPAYLLPNHLLLALAEALPRDVQGLRALADPVPPFLNHHLDQLHTIILACREVPEEPQVLGVPANMLAMVAPRPRDALCAAHDLSRALFSFLEESDLEQPAAAAAGARAGAPPDLASFAAPPSPWMTPPASPRSAPASPASSTSLPNGKKSTLNAHAQTFVPPYDRYKMYRAISQVEEVKVLEEKKAKVMALSKGSNVIREEVLTQLRLRTVVDLERPTTSWEVFHAEPQPSTSRAGAQPPTAHAEAQASTSRAGAQPAASPPPPEREEAEEPLSADEKKTAQRKRKRHEKLESKNAAEPAKVNKTTSKQNKQEGKKAFDYKKVNYDAFHRDDGKGRKQPKMK